MRVVREGVLRKGPCPLEGVNLVLSRRREKLPTLGDYWGELCRGDGLSAGL